jgi:hypothetical protein
MTVEAASFVLMMGILPRFDWHSMAKELGKPKALSAAGVDPPL